jgi:tetratricopeptide (TPR) repeat protein
MSTKLQAFACLAILVLLTGCGVWARGKSHGYALNAKAYSEKGDIDMALQAAQQSVTYDESNPGGWYWLGDASFKKGDIPEAIRSCQKFLTFEPTLNSTPAWANSIFNCYFYLGWANYRVGNFDDSNKNFNIAIQRNAKINGSFTGRGWAYYRKASYDQAIQDFSTALGMNPSDWDAFTGRGWAHYRKANYEEALKDFTAALSINQKASVAYRGRGFTYHLLGRFEAAVDDFNAALQYTKSEDKSGMQDTLRGKAFAYLGLGDTDTAISLINQAKAALDYNERGDLALIYYAHGDKHRAWEYQGGQGMLGIQGGKKGALEVEVIGTLPGSPAQQAGLLKGDIVLKFNGERIFDLNDFIRKNNASIPGTTVALTVIREGTERTIFVQVAAADPWLESSPLLAPILAKKPGGLRDKQVARQDSSSSLGFLSDDVDRVPARNIPPNMHAYAVVIGIEQYREKLPKSDFADRDAQLMGEYLTKVLGYPEEHVVLRTNEKASLTDLIKYLEGWLPNNVEKDSSVFVYYSGHGAPNPKTGEAYLVPYDGDPTFVEKTGYSLKRLYEHLDKLPAKDITVVLDSCFSGAGGRSVLAQGAKPMVLSVENAMVASGKTVVLAASAGDQISSAYAEKGHGLLTYFFLKGLQGEGDLNKDGVIEMAELYEYLKPQVQKVARKQFNNEQTPQLLASPELLRKGGGRLLERAQ